jgi:hypothetical protein
MQVQPLECETLLVKTTVNAVLSRNSERAAPCEGMSLDVPLGKISRGPGGTLLESRPAHVDGDGRNIIKMQCRCSGASAQAADLRTLLPFRERADGS